MLDRARDSDRNVQLWSNDLAALHGASAGNDDFDSGQFKTIGLGLFFADDA